MKLEDLTRDAVVKGLIPEGLATVVDVRWFGSAVVELTYKDAEGHIRRELVYRDREAIPEIVVGGRPWSSDGHGEPLRLVSEAGRIRLVDVFAPPHPVDPLPHPITVVDGDMSSRRPLRFLLADDPGAGQSIIGGLLIKELVVRDDLRRGRCLTCCPGNLTAQWQDGMYGRFPTDLVAVTRNRLEGTPSGNPCAEHGVMVSRLDPVSRKHDIGVLGKWIQSTERVPQVLAPVPVGIPCHGYGGDAAQVIEPTRPVTVTDRPHRRAGDARQLDDRVGTMSERHGLAARTLADNEPVASRPGSRTHATGRAPERERVP
jgi:hypothetical protein